MPTIPLTTPSGVPIPDLVSPMLLGFYFNWALFGALTVQVYVYYLSFPNDRTANKYLVLSVYLLEVLQTAMSAKDSFRFFATGWGNVIELNKVGLAGIDIPLLSSIVTFLTQSFYAWRIWLLRGNVWLSSVILALSVAQAVGGIWSGIFTQMIGELDQVLKRAFAAAALRHCSTILCDLIIAVSMTHYLYTSKTGIRTTNVALFKLIRVTVETNLICSVFAIMDVTFWLSFPHYNFFLAPSLTLSKLYSNSLLAMLNARVRFVGGRIKSSVSEDIPMSTSTSHRRHGAKPSVDSRFDPNSSHGHGVTINIEQEVFDDSTLGRSLSKPDAALCKPKAFEYDLNFDLERDHLFYGSSKRRITTPDAESGEIIPDLQEDVLDLASNKPLPTTPY